ncbi:MAG: response regulator transcription factor [Symploca sp. SIO2E9]|nr:response regulator transcription factor [Symploca sp. SIO2E9]
MRILLVEDDAPLAENLADMLINQLYVVDIVSDGEAAWEQIKTIDYDLILLDLLLPKLDGVSLCKRLRSQGIKKPILMLTARDTITDKVRALDIGVDDYIVKPFDLSELLARVRALLRRGGSSSASILEWRGLRLEPSTHKVTYEDQPLHLSSKEYSILELLLRNGQQVLTRSVILEHIWSFDNPPSENTIKTHINSLRHKLKAMGAPDGLIETVRVVGYCLKKLS